MSLFLDTNVLINHVDMLDTETHYYISDITLMELENIKTQRTKDEKTKYGARRAINWIDQNGDNVSVICQSNGVDETLAMFALPKIPDYIICASAYYVLTNFDSELVFCSEDICCRTVAEKVFGLKIERFRTDVDCSYTGFLSVQLDNEEMAYFYEHMNDNVYDLEINQYIEIKDREGTTVDSYRWNGESHEPITKKNIKSLYFDKLKAKDLYQQFAIDSLINNTITAISGKAGSGKSLLSLMVAMWLIETGKYERLVIMFNPTKTRGASDLGYYSGDFLEKAMQNSIGQVLTTKFGDRYAVDLLLQQNKLKLVSMADARGMEITDSEILWITEAQNTSVDLIKLCLSRVSSGAKVFIEGDYTSQVDASVFEGTNNGLKRVIDVFRGHEEFGYVQLQNVWRSKIAELCELL